MSTPEAFLVKLAMQSAATWHALGPRIFPGEMTVETVLKVEHGYQGVQPSLQSSAPNASTSTNVFRKQA